MERIKPIKNRFNLDSLRVAFACPKCQQQCQSNFGTLERDRLVRCAKCGIETRIAGDGLLKLRQALTQNGREAIIRIQQVDDRLEFSIEREF